MRRHQLRLRLAAFAAAIAIAVAGGASAQVRVTSDFTGIWNQPDQESQGFVVQIVGQPDGSTEGVAYWFTYDDSGNPMWVVGQGPVVGNEINMDFLRVDGPQFLESPNPNARNVTNFGSGSMAFSNCDIATVEIQLANAVTGTGLETFTINRLSRVLSTNCTGGLADDIPSNAPATEIEVALRSTGIDPDASGKAELETGPGYANFEVEVDDLELGDYDLLVGGSLVGSITVVNTPTGTEGELEFKSPTDDEKPLLNFDPRGQVIEVSQNGNVLLTSDSLPVDPNPISQQLEIEVDLENSGVFPAASGDAEFEINGSRRKFDIEVEDLPVGDYPVRVGGMQVGVLIAVVQTNGDVEGELEFGNPPDDDETLLTFDPRGQLVEIVDSNGVLLSVVFPQTNTGSNNGDGSDDDGSDDGGSGDDGSGDDGSGDDDDEVNLKRAFDNTGVDSDANGEFEFTIDNEGRKAKLELDDLDNGVYQFAVDGELITQVTISDESAEVRFSDPQEDDDQLLNFDPRGKLLTVAQDGITYLTLQFPN
ncbi:MAG: hypothetical protein AB8B96_20945 [Lysobacterales bacterium]